jgi:hypothetical protein
MAARPVLSRLVSSRLVFLAKLSDRGLTRQTLALLTRQTGLEWITEHGSRMTPHVGQSRTIAMSDHLR